MNIYNQPIRALASVQWPWRGNGPDNCAGPFVLAQMNPPCSWPSTYRLRYILSWPTLYISINRPALLIGEGNCSKLYPELEQLYR